VSASVSGARELVDALLANADVPLVEGGEPDPSPADLGAAAGWRFASHEHGIEADVYVLEDAQGVQDAVARLLEAAGPQDDRGLPGVSSNGPLVFAVRSTAGAEAVEDAYAALSVAGALAGEEE
jgi:uncharacterized Ntn-hydrolase superfamily protein